MTTNASRAANFLSGYANKAGFIGGLAALICVLLMTGCAHKPEAPPQQTVDRKDLVYKEVADPARAEKIVALMEKLEVEMKLQSEINNQGQQTILMLNTGYDTTSEQLQKQMDVIQTSRSQNRQRILDTYFQIKALMTRQEWEAISKPEDQMLMQMINKAKVPVK
jgi:hypothetical protein